MPQADEKTRRPPARLSACKDYLAIAFPAEALEHGRRKEVLT